MRLTRAAIKEKTKRFFYSAFLVFLFVDHSNYDGVMMMLYKRLIENVLFVFGALLTTSLILVASKALPQNPMNLVMSNLLHSIQVAHASVESSQPSQISTTSVHAFATQPVTFATHENKHHSNHFEITQLLDLRSQQPVCKAGQPTHPSGFLIAHL